MLGFLKSVDVLPKKPASLKMMDDPVVLSTIQSPYGDDNKYLQRMQCVGRDKILTTGNSGEIKQIDRNGLILQTMPTYDLVWALSITLQQEPVFSLSIVTIKRTEIYIYKQDKIELLLCLKDWYPVGLCYAKNGDLLVSMRSTDLKRSRIARYSGSTEIQEIQYDGLGQSLLSTDIAYLFPVTENSNGDICVADYAGMEVVVMDPAGILRFKYSGNPNYRDFRPFHIASDVNAQILTFDTLGNLIHIIDGDGNFVRYIEHPCYGGLSIDTDHNLVIGDRHTEKLKSSNIWNNEL
ncbi:uncharacterized protein LOC133174577 [Saccostrea echinata]|uniref:uncharacterized protein LOC133174577 n=1 Tax=Saccostrea echinata TaxID=191078 RepID=UPI002A832320|nr:uncharacterized protein LOC133174577 [Saccostrea echinata]